jgi:hypothetical protein
MTSTDSRRADWFTSAARFAFTVALIFTLVMALLPHPPRVPLDQLGDKLEHMTAFATLSLLASLSFPRAGLWRIGERLSFLGALIEVMQALPAVHRDCSIFDWLADTAAIAATLAVVAAIRRARRGREMIAG